MKLKDIEKDAVFADWVSINLSSNNARHIQSSIIAN